MPPTERQPIDREDLALLSRFLLWRVARARPVDTHHRDVATRLRRAGHSFRQRTRPLSPHEVEDVVERLRTTRVG